MSKERKQIPHDEIRRLRFPDTPERLKFREYQKYSIHLQRLGSNFQDLSRYKGSFELYNRQEVPTLPKEHQERFNELEKLIRQSDAHINEVYIPAIAEAKSLLEQETDKLKPVIISQVRVSRSEREIVLGWAENAWENLTPLLESEETSLPDPHKNAEASYIWQTSLSNGIIRYGNNIVRSDRIHFHDPDIKINFSINTGTEDDIRVKQFRLALEITPSLVKFITDHLGLQADELEKGIENEDIEAQAGKIFNFLFDSSLTLDKQLPRFDEVYQGDFD